MKNRNCPHCNANLDGDLVIETFREMYKDEEEALKAAKCYAGWEPHGLQNRWGREIGVYCQDRDRTVAYRCPDCKKEWNR